MKNQIHIQNLKYLLLILILIFLFLIVQSTYSKYIETNTTPGKFKISEWNILVNDKNITELNTYLGTLPLDFKENNTNVTPGVAVPSSIGSFDIKIDSTGTTIPFKYDVLIEDYNISGYTIEDFKIISYKIDNNEEIQLTSDATSVSNIIEPDKNITNINFKVQWYDVDRNTYNGPEDRKDILNNYEDAAKASKSTNNVTSSEISTDIYNKITIPVKVTVTQLPKNYTTNNTIISNTNTEE